MTFNDVLGGSIFDGFFASIKPINIEANYTVTTQLGYTIKVTDLPVNKYTWLEVVAVYKRHWGTQDQWDAGGYAGLGNFDISEPVLPYSVYRAHFPYQPGPQP